LSSDANKLSILQFYRFLANPAPSFADIVADIVTEVSNVHDSQSFESLGAITSTNATVMREYKSMIRPVISPDTTMAHSQYPPNLPGVYESTGYYANPPPNTSCCQLPYVGTPLGFTAHNIYGEFPEPYQVSSAFPAAYPVKSGHYLSASDHNIGSSGGGLHRANASHGFVGRHRIMSARSARIRSRQHTGSGPFECLSQTG